MSVDGTYNLTINTPMGKQEGKLTVAADGGALNGTMEQGGNSVEIANGTVDGNNVTWEAGITTPMPMTLKFAGTVDGDKISGEVELGAFGKAAFEGTKA